MIERPKIVITTGAAPGSFAILFGKLLRARTIWLDSMANMNKTSVSGEKVFKYIDLFLTQWPDLEREGGPYYEGSVI